jgi:hypothetical protein
MADWVQSTREQIAFRNFLAQTTNTLRLTFNSHEQVAAGNESLREFAGHERKLVSLQQQLVIQLLGERMLGKKSLRPTWLVSGVEAAVGAVGAVFGWLRSRPSWYLDTVTAAGTSIGRLATCSALLVVAFGILNLWLIGMALGLPVLTDAERLAVVGWHSALTFLEGQPGMGNAIEAVIAEPAIGEKVGKVSLSAVQEGRGWIMNGYRTVLLLELTVAMIHVGLLVSVLYRRLLRQAV